MALVSMGVYIFNKRTLLGTLDLLCGPRNAFDFGHDIVPALIRFSRAYAYDFRDKFQNAPCYWRDIGTIDAYYDASMELLQIESPVLVRQSQPRMGAGALVSRSVISPGVEVEMDAAVYDSILMPGVRVGAGAQLRRVIVEEGVHVPAGFRVGNIGAPAAIIESRSLKSPRSASAIARGLNQRITRI